MIPLERTILRQLLSDQEYAERVVPYLRDQYFSSSEAAIIFKLYSEFYNKFRVVPQPVALRIKLDAHPGLSEQQAKAAQDALDEIEQTPVLDASQNDWLLQQTEEYCRERAIYCALQQSIRMMDDPKATRHAIPDLLKEALAVSFDTHIGHNFFADAEKRYEFYHQPEKRLPFDLAALNAMTKGGVPQKTLNVVMAGTNVGKSLFLCHMAAAAVRMGKKVLYITLEMAEERIAERIDANMMNLPLNDIEEMPRDVYLKKLAALRSTSAGELIIKEYPTAGAHAGHFRALIHELRLKQNFVPDVLIVDYLTICASSRIKPGAGVNTYTLYKFVAEELRGLGVEFQIPVWTAAQVNREGHGSSDPDITNAGESFAIPQTADFMFTLVQTEDLEKIGQVMLRPMKNRYQKKQTFKRVLLGVDTDRMKLYDLSPEQLAKSVSAGPDDSEITANVKPSFSAFSRPRRRPLAALKKEFDG